MLAGFPTDYHTNWQWWDLISKSSAMILDGFPSNPRPIVQVIDDWVTNRKLGLIVEAKVGRGKLLICSIDLQSDLANRPVARQMLHSLTSYMNGPAFEPRQSVDMVRVRGSTLLTGHGAPCGYCRVELFLLPLHRECHL